MYDQGFIVVWRKMLYWKWFTNPSTSHLFLYLLLKVTHQDMQQGDLLIKRGQVKTGRKKIAAETGLTEKQVRTALSNLSRTKEISTETASKYSIITLTNYEFHRELIDQAASKGPAKGQEKASKGPEESHPEPAKPLDTHTPKNGQQKNKDKPYVPTLPEDYPQMEGQQRASKGPQYNTQNNKINNYNYIKKSVDRNSIAYHPVPPSVIDETLAIIWQAQPEQQRKSPATARRALQGALERGHDPEMIIIGHRAWADCENWKKESGKYAWGLKRFFDSDKFLESPVDSYRTVETWTADRVNQIRNCSKCKNEITVGDRMIDGQHWGCYYPQDGEKQNSAVVH